MANTNGAESALIGGNGYYFQAYAPTFVMFGANNLQRSSHWADSTTKYFDLVEQLAGIRNYNGFVLRAT